MVARWWETNRSGLSSELNKDKYFVWVPSSFKALSCLNYLYILPIYFTLFLGIRLTSYGVMMIMLDEEGEGVHQVVSLAFLIHSAW